MWFISRNVGFWPGLCNTHSFLIFSASILCILEQDISFPGPSFCVSFFSFINQISVERQQCVQAYYIGNPGTGEGPKTWSLCPNGQWNLKSNRRQGRDMKT